MTKPDILRALAALTASPPGMNSANYDSAKAYRADMYRIRQHRRDAERLLTDVALDDRITAEDLLKRLGAGRRVYLTVSGEADYHAGQYYPVEYRKAVAQLLSDVIWDTTRDTLPNEIGRGDHVRALMRKRYGARMGREYFT